MKRQLTEIEGLSDQFVGDYWEKFATRKVKALYGKRASQYYLRGQDFEKNLKAKKCKHRHEDEEVLEEVEKDTKPLIVLNSGQK